MSLRKSPPRTPAQRAASRANSRKSTGPRTLGGKKVVSLNALKDGRTAQAATRPLWQAMVELGEDPARYRSLLRDVLNSYPPQSPLEMRLCEEITQLMLNSERIQRAQEARVVRAYQKLENSREKQLREMEGSASYDALQADVLENGLRRVADSPAKFSETNACLERLLKRVESGDFSQETELNALYGKQPTFRGAGIINAFHALAQNPSDHSLAASLRMMILEEMRDIAAESGLYYREHVEISQAMRLECLAPACDREYLQLQRQSVELSHELERKIKLLVSLQANTRRVTLESTEEPASAVEDPLGWLQVRVQPPPKSEAPPGGAELQALEDSAEARAVALRLKINTPRKVGLTEEERNQQIFKAIREVYGIEPEEQPEPVAKNTAFSAGGPEKPKQDAAGPEDKSAPPDAEGEASKA